MSIWTHVAAIIRIDSCKGLYGPQSKKEIEEILGPIANYGSSEEVWDKCTLPTGSEGSLKYDIWENPDESCMAAFTVSIFGDLRNYEETDSIKEWFFNFCNKFSELIRQAICLAQIEGCKSDIFQYEKEL